MITPERTEQIDDYDAIRRSGAVSAASAPQPKLPYGSRAEPSRRHERHNHLNRIAGINLKAVQPGRGLAAENSSGGRISKCCAESSKSCRISGLGNIGSLK
jgi:hypothetical protein